MSKAKTPTRKRGRPRLPADQGKRVPLNMRTTREVREKMEAAARRSGRSLAQEVEWRLEESLRAEETKYDEFLTRIILTTFTVGYKKTRTPPKTLFLSSPTRKTSFGALKV